MSFSLLHPRDQIVAIMERIYGHDMTTTSGGNVSARICGFVQGSRESGWQPSHTK
jgi:ribulose-5-phosphate 4-epimerase/fuculose-1-phosphate aldolase